MKSYTFYINYSYNKSFSVENGSSFIAILNLRNPKRKKETKKENHKDLVNSNLHILRFAYEY